MAAEILIVENDPGIVALPLFRPNKRDSRVTEIPLELNESKGFTGVKRSLYPFETFQPRITPTKVFSTSLFPTDFG